MDCGSSGTATFKQGGDIADEDEENSSSSLELEDETIEEKLDDFRNKWKQELEQKRDSLRRVISNDNGVRTEFDEEIHETNTESEARYLFGEGSRLERSGQMYEAVACYRRATQLDPDIEFKMYKLEKQMNARRNSGNDNTNTTSEVTEAQSMDDLLERFSHLSLDEEGNFCLCFPETQNSSRHISSLPYEVVMYILKWVISSELDMKSLEQISLVCRGLYLTARDTELWRLASVRTWGILNANASHLEDYDNSWRHMFINRPRLNFNGTYISRTTYIRHGESSFQDATYRPMYLVEYYRYLRFFPGGSVLMLTTPEDPYASLPKLRYQKQPRSSLVLNGHYCLLEDNCVSAVFKRIHVDEEPAGRRGRAKATVTTTEQVFQVQLQINCVRGMNNHQLVWTNYSVGYRRSNGPEALTTFELTLNKFPPFYFSRVKSYCTASDSPLV